MTFGPTINMVGLVMDICGAWLLAQGLVLNGDSHLKLLAGTNWDMNANLLKELVANAYDARFGLMFLILGFVCQFDGTLGERHKTLSWLLLVFLVVGLIVWRVFKERAVLKRTERIINLELPKLVVSDDH